MQYNCHWVAERNISMFFRAAIKHPASIEGLQIFFRFDIIEPQQRGSYSILCRERELV